MPEPDLIELFVAQLTGAGIHAYMISGSVAAIEYGEPRATLDVDIALSISTVATRQLPTIYPAPDYYCPPLEVLALEVARPARGHFNVIHVPSGLKADFYPSRSHPLFDWAMQHRKEVQTRTSRVWYAPPEYVILWKLEFYREGREQKHLRDIRGMLEVSAQEIDRPFVEKAVAAQRLDPEWREVISEL